MTLCRRYALSLKRSSNDRETEVMIENAPRESAKIYQFPLGGRTGLAIQRDGVASVSAFKPAPAIAVLSGSWYHDEAIRQDAELARKR